MKPGQYLGGHYRIESLIGQGGMSTVYRGTDVHTDETVAIKVLQAAIARSNPEMLPRFAREADILRQLNHPNIIRVLAAFSDTGQPVIVMEYMGGGDLSRLLKTESLLPLAQVIEIGLDLADALARAHHLKISHRDLKPANVLLAEDGTLRLTDFGIARMDAAERLTGPGVAVGTADYMSPEALRGEADALSDIWAFGVMLFELLTGQRPFPGTTTAQVITAILMDAPLDLEKLRPDAPVALVDLIYRMLIRERHARLASIRVAGAELEMLLHKLPANSSRLPARKIVSNDMLPELSPFSLNQHPVSKFPRHNLPAATTPFVGREHELSQIHELLLNQSIRLITLTGPGGIGKTRLALETGLNLLQATPSSEAFADGTFFIALAPLTATDSILNTLAEAVSFRFYPGDEPRQQLLNFLCEKMLLLIFDNFEHILEGVSLVSDILHTAPGVKIMVTSRTRLNLQGETLVNVEGLELPDSQNSRLPATYSAIQLFQQSAQRARPDFEMDATTLQQVTRICRIVEGMPLAIELAAAWVQVLSLPEIAAEIDQNLDFLESDLSDIPDRQRSLRTVFEYTWSLMTPEEQVIFRRLALFRGGFSRDAAQAVSGATLKQILALINTSVLKRNAETGYYSIHEMLRQYAEEALQLSTEAEKISDAHSHYYLDSLHSLEANLKGHGQIEALKRIDAGVDNVQVAWMWAAQQGHTAELERGLESLWLYFLVRGNLVGGEALLEKAAGFLREQPESPVRSTTLAAILLRQSFLLNWLRYRQKLERVLDEASRLVGQDSPAILRGWLIYQQGDFALTFQSASASRPYFEQALAIFQDTGDVWMVGSILYLLSVSYAFRQQPKHECQFDMAHHYLKQAEVIFRQCDDMFRLGIIYHSLGIITSRKGDAGWLEYYQRSQSLSRQLGNRWIVVVSMLNVGNELRSRGQVAQALPHLNASLTLAEETGDYRGMAEALNSLSMAAWQVGDFENAQHYAERLNRQTRETELPVNWQTVSLLRTGQAHFALGGYAEAYDCFLRSYDITAVQGRQADLTWISTLLGDIAAAQHQFEKAQQHYDLALITAREMHQAYQTAVVLANLGRIAYEQGNHDSARTYWMQSLDWYQSNTTRDQTEVVDYVYLETGRLTAQAQLAALDEDFQAGQRHLAEALYRSQSGMPGVLTFSVLTDSMEMLYRQRQPEKALEVAAFIEHDERAFVCLKDRAHRVKDVLQSELAASRFSSIYESGLSLHLEVIVDYLLAEFHEAM